MWKKDVGGWANPRESGSEGAGSSAHQTPGSTLLRSVTLAPPGAMSYDHPPRGVAGGSTGSGMMSPRDSSRRVTSSADLHPMTSHGASSAIAGGGGFFGALGQQPPIRATSPSTAVGGGRTADLDSSRIGGGVGNHHLAHTPAPYNLGASPLLDDSLPVQENQRWVTASGIVPSQVLAAVEQLEIQFGRVVQYRWPGGLNCNWFHLEFESTFDAQRSVFQKHILVTNLDVQLGLSWCCEVAWIQQQEAQRGNSPFRGRSVEGGGRQSVGGSTNKLTTGRLQQVERARVPQYSGNRTILAVPKTMWHYFLRVGGGVRVGSRTGGMDTVAGEGAMPGLPEYLSWNFISCVLFILFLLYQAYMPLPEEL